MKLIHDYLGREQCDSVKGVFILLVFFCHFMQYVHDAGGAFIDLHLGQLIVTLFLFYSGYGVMESMKTKGDSYIRDIPVRRILTTLINFDIAVLVFVVAGVALGRKLTFVQTLLSLVCWDSVGNSNWYIFTILACYGAAYIAGRLAKQSWRGPVCLGLLTVCMVGLSFVKGSWWYDTMLCFPAGMFYSQYKTSIDAFCGRHYTMALVTVVLVIIAMGCGLPVTIRGLVPNLRAIAFAVLVVLVTMLVPIRKKWLGWFGRNLFPMYIYQRLPMIVLFSLDPEGFASWRMPIYFITSFLVTVVIAKFYPVWQVNLRYE